MIRHASRVVAAAPRRTDALAAVWLLGHLGGFALTSLARWQAIVYIVFVLSVLFVVFVVFVVYVLSSARCAGSRSDDSDAPPFRMQEGRKSAGTNLVLR